MTNAPASEERPPKGRPTRFQLARELEQLAAAEPVDLGGGAIRDWRGRAEAFSRENNDPSLLKRLARLHLKQGDRKGALRLFMTALEVDPRDPEAGTFAGAELERQGDFAAALAMAEAAIAHGAGGVGAWLRVANLRTRNGDEAGAERAARDAMARFPDQERAGEWLLRHLQAAKRGGDAAELARELLRRPELGLAQLHQVHAALHAEEAPEAGEARERLVSAAREAPDGQLWLGRLYRLEGRLEEALQAFGAAVAADPANAPAVKERANLALGFGRWGRDADAILAGRPHAEPGTALERRIAAADELLRRFGGSLEAAAADPEAFAHVSTPETVFELVAKTAPTGDLEGREGLVMCGGSFAAGGAERILAASYRDFRASPPLGHTRLVLFEFEASAASGFYFPLTGAGAEEVHVAKSTPPREAPIAWLPLGLGGRTQALYDLFVQWRPRVVHAWLDTVNLAAGFAGLLAGVPKIFLHIHNMRPTELVTDDRFMRGFDGAYRALLSRPEVTLVGCADACVADYLEWAKASGTSRTVYNGFDFSIFRDDVGAQEKAALRERFGVPAGAQLVGTALRFTELKRPDRWVGMAAQVAEALPETHFIMFGDGDLRAQTQARAAELGLGERIHFPGRVDNIQELLPMLDLFVLSSRTEGLPNVLIEAQACGVPVVSYDIGGVKETVEAGVTGLLVSKDTTEALAAAVLSALGDHEGLAQAAAEAPKFVRAKFSVERMVADLRELLTGEAAPGAGAEARVWNG
ncbi:MAG TPA: glycosyltransferase [Caulobacteraceae bacterium]